MKKTQNRQLTRSMLKEMGFHEITWDDKENKWIIDRYWHNRKSKVKKHTFIKTTVATCKHKYTTDKTYPTITFSYNNKGYCYPLARFIYAWFNGEIKEGWVVDHIDNNPFNNRLENLQALTPEQNLAKRFIDNPDANRNQWDAIKKEKMNKAVLKEYYKAQSELVNVTNHLTALSADYEDYALMTMTDITKHLENITSNIVAIIK